MQETFRLLFLIRRYNATDGASLALYNYIKNNNRISDYKILCRWIIKAQKDINIQEVNNCKEIQKELSSRQYDLVHYFKTGGYDIFNWTHQAIKKLRLKLPMVTTVCQRPSYPGLLLSPNEIKYSDRLVLIDKAAYNDSLYTFINTERKEMIYFGSTPELIEKTGQMAKLFRGNGKVIVYGRGSTLSKCPKDMVSVFDAISIKDKCFVVAGITDNSWLHQQVKQRDDIIVYPPRSFDEWLEICNTFDVFLYYIPPTSHSSIDGTLGHAMLLQKPVVYYGAEAPKERFTHGENGFIAKTTSEIAYYATLLGKDKMLRQKIGEKARESSIRDFSVYRTVEKYNSLYQQIVSSPNLLLQGIPIKYYWYFIKKSRNQIFRYMLAGSNIEKYYRKKHPLQA